MFHKMVYLVNPRPALSESPGSPPAEQAWVIPRTTPARTCKEIAVFARNAPYGDQKGTETPAFPYQHGSPATAIERGSPRNHPARAGNSSRVRPAQRPRHGSPA